MTREEEIIEREIAFTDWWYKEHTGVPTYADAIEWTRKQMIEKVCEWLSSHVESYVMPDAWVGYYIDEDELIDDLKKAMEE